MLTTNGPLVAFCNGRVYAAGGLRDADLTTPYIVYHIGNATDEQMADDEQLVEINRSPRRQFFQIYIQDQPADYSLVDQGVGLVKAAIRGVGSPTDNIITTRYLETSQDLNDDVLGTIFRYVRFQFVMS